MEQIEYTTNNTQKNMSVEMRKFKQKHQDLKII